MPDRTVAPPFSQIEKFSIKEPARYDLGNGLLLFTIQAGTQPVVKLELIFHAGKWTEQIHGAAFFTGQMLREGAGTYNSFDLSSLFESVGAHLEISPGLDYIVITLHTIEKHLPKLLPVLKLLILKPGFPEEEFKTLKNLQIQKLRINNEKNSYLASKKLRESLFGNTHPYGHILEEAQINDLDRNELIRHFQKNIYKKPFTIISSGLFSEASINSIIDTFSDIQSNSQIAVADKPQEYSHSDVAIDKSESSQSSIRIGCISIPMDHPDYPGLLFVNEILGGFFGSRLMKNIREEKGLTYGIYSSISTLKNASFFFISADVKKDFRTEVFDEIKLELSRLSSEKASGEEIETVRNYMLGQLQASINTPFALASKFKSIYFSGLSYDYYRNLVQAIKTINTDRILELSSKYLSYESMVKVYVG